MWKNENKDPKCEQKEKDCDDGDYVIIVTSDDLIILYDIEENSCNEGRRWNG